MVPLPAVPSGTVPLLRVALGAPGDTATLAVWVTAVPAIVAETTRLPGVVALSRPVVDPLLRVRVAGWVSVFPVPLADRVTARPEIGLSNASRAVTVMVLRLDPPDAVMVAGAALTWLFPAVTGPGVPVAVNTTGLPLTSSPERVASRVLAPTFFPSVHPPTIATPSLPVTGLAPSSDPSPPVTLNVTGMPPRRLPSSSRTTTAGRVATAVATAAACSLPAVASIDAGAPTSSDTLPVTEAKPSAAKMSLRVPGEPRIARSAKATRPPTSLVELVPPPCCRPQRRSAR